VLLWVVKRNDIAITNKWRLVRLHAMHGGRELADKYL
jgi:hypothetical protein